MTHRILFTIFCLLIMGELFAQGNHAFIWRGFEHSWTYNHRINRLGSYIDFQDQAFQSVHTSASGLGADSTTFSQHYTYVESEQLNFQAGKVSVKLYGKEKRLLSQNIEVVVPAKDFMHGKEQYVTLLNGFDLKAKDRADKLQLFRVHVEDAVYAAEMQEIRFNLQIALVVNCQSLECSRFNQKTTYDLDIHYLIVAGNADDLVTTPKQMTKNYTWGKKNEYQHPVTKGQINGKKDPTLQNATLGIQSFAITLDNAHWTVAYNNTVAPLNYDSRIGRMEIATDMYFKEWVQGMKKESAKPKHSKFSSKKKGWGVLDMGVLLMQVKSAKIHHGKHSGSSFWGGWNSNPDKPNAVMKKRLEAIND